LAAQLALEKKGADITILDLRGFDIGCDFFVIVTAQSDPHVRAIAEWITDEAARRQDVRPWHVEGLRLGQWVLLDYVDWVVHVFRAETRGYYMLERLWGDAPRETIGDDPPDSTADAS
jgi:ribosome-associated protein